MINGGYFFFWKCCKRKSSFFGGLIAKGRGGFGELFDGFARFLVAFNDGIVIVHLVLRTHVDLKCRLVHCYFVLAKIVVAVWGLLMFMLL